METTLTTAVLCTASLLLPCAHSQPSGADDQTLATLRAKADTGDAQSQSELCWAFYSGKFGVETNYAEAVKWYRNAAEQNYANAQGSLGVYYANGVTPNGDLRKGSEPTPDSKLVNCEATQRAVVLVHYDAIREEPEVRQDLYKSNTPFRESRLEDSLFWRSRSQTDSAQDQDKRNPL